MCDAAFSSSSVVPDTSCCRAIVVFVSISGWGQYGPDAGLPAYDPAVIDGSVLPCLINAVELREVFELLNDGSVAGADAHDFVLEGDAQLGAVSALYGLKLDGQDARGAAHADSLRLIRY